jgi:Ca-activated chloride channel family protein
MNKGHSKKTFILVSALMLSIAALFLGCYGPFGLVGDSQAKGAAEGVQMRSVVQSVLQIQKTAQPKDIYIQGSGLGNEVTTVTIDVTGYGGTMTTAVPIDVVFAIDSSGSMAGQSGSDPDDLRLAAAKDFVDKLNPAVDRAAVVSWDDDIDFTYPPTAPYPYPASNYYPFVTPPGPALPTSDTMTSDFAALKTKIDTVDSSGYTNLAMGLQQSIRMLKAAARPESVDVVIFLTDGIDNSSWPDAILANWVTYAKNNGYRIYSIGLGNDIDEQPLKDMATQTGGHYYAAPTADNLQALYDMIYAEVVSSTAPSAVDVVEVTREYIVEEGSFSPAPDSVVTDPLSGQTTITWLDVARHVGNLDDRLASDETFSVSFKAKSSQVGVDLPVEAAEAAVNYLDPSGVAQSQSIPQAFITVTGKILVSIDIKPGSDPNSINTKAENGVIPVAILTTSDFNALQVDHTTVTFEGAREAHVDKMTGVARRHEEDVDNDGDIDLVFHFRHYETSLTSASTVGVVKGMTYSGVAIEGTDSVRMLH